MKRLILVMIPIAGVAGAAKPAASAWMGGLDPGKELFRLSIPGTHNSAARFEPVTGSAKCQDTTLTAQLEMGVRFLDLRCRHAGDRFSLFHGSVDQRLGFDAALAEITGFLETHTGECVLVSVKEEHTAGSNSRTFAATFGAYAGRNPGRWWLKGRLPALADARGRMVLIRRFAAGGEMGIDATRWPDNAAFENPVMVVQDCYRVEDPAVKWRRVEDTLHAAAGPAGAGRLVLNFASGYRPGVLGIPDIRAVSGVVNRRLDAWLEDVSPGSCGCVIMDFASARTCDLVIRTNFPDDKGEAPREVIKVPVTERKVPGPPEGAVSGPLPRAVLMLSLCERGVYPSDPMRTSYRVFDPAEPEKGLRTVFTGPGQGQYLRYLTPLVGGYGLASGRLDRDKERDRDGPLFWFNLLDGTPGPEVDADLWGERTDGPWLVGSECVKELEEGEISRISRHDPLKGIVRTMELDFAYLNWLASGDVLGVARMRNGWRVVRVDLDASTCEVLGMPPPGFDADHPARRGYDIHPAGIGGADGMYAIRGFSLWYHPRCGAWFPVIRDVPIVKTFGGAAPWLPVRYVGNGRFAVAKTVKDEVKVPKAWPQDESMFGAAEAVTLLVDGLTGKVLKQSKPFVYNHNPEPQIPHSWWSMAMKPKSEPPDPEPARKSLFRWNEKTRELRFAGDRLLRLGVDDEREESGDGRYSLVYDKCPHAGAGIKTLAAFRIIDGETGRIHTAEVESDFHEIWTEPSWQVLVSP